MAAAPPNQYARVTQPAPAATSQASLLPPDFAEFAGQAGYQVEPDGRVYTVSGGKKSYIPPWIVWQTSRVGKDPTTGELTPEGRAYRTPGSDPSSKWRFMFENGGPFTKQSQWDTDKGTYKGSTDWGTLLGTIAVGGLIGAGVASAVGGGTAAAGGGSGGYGGLSGTTPALEGIAAGPGATTIAGGTAAATTAPAYVGADIAGTAAASTAAGTGGGVAATTGGVGSWLTSPYGQLIGTGASVAGNIYAANKQASASEEAARLQDKQFEEALAATKQEQDYSHGRDTLKDNQYADYLSRLNPYGQTGQASNNRLSQFMGQPAAAQTPLTPNPPPNPLAAQRTTIPATAAQQSAANSFVPTAVKNSPTASQVPQGPGPYANWPVYQAPDGSKRKISPEMAAQADAAGLQRVG